MIRRFEAALAALPAAALLLLPVPAPAQYYPPPPPQPYYRNPPAVYQEQLPPPGAQDQQYYSDRYQRGPQRAMPYPDDEEAALPTPGFAQPSAPPGYAHPLDEQLPGGMPSNRYEPGGVIRPPGTIGSAPNVVPQRAPSSATAALPPEDQPEEGQPKELPANLKRQMVEYPTREPAGTIVIDTPHTYLYLVLGQGRAIRYGIGVGREGFTWAGTERVSKMKEWPDWFPPSEMIERQPYLPRMMAGGPGNPLGARALYLGKTLYRIHGTNQPSTIGQTVSSGCIRLLNEDIEDLFSRVQVGTRVVVLPGAPPPDTAAASANPPVAMAPANAAPRNDTAISGSGLPPIR